MNILTVIDMQNDFIDMALGTGEAQAIVDKVAAKISAFSKGKIYVTLDTHSEDYLNTQEGKFLPVEHCIKGTLGWKLNAKVAEALKQQVNPVIYLEKPTFGSVELAKTIEADASKGEIKVEMIGLCTDICVVSNALLIKAALPETEISVDAGCVAGVTPVSNDAALTTMKMCQIVIKE